MLRGSWISLTGPTKVLGGVARGTPADLSFLKRLIEAGELRTVIDTRYPLAEIAKAHRHAEGGHKKGHVVVVI
jgi:NADPH:quinone reductase-like Zn-dependent oxidoreductase